MTYGGRSQWQGHGQGWEFCSACSLVSLLVLVIGWLLLIYLELESARRSTKVSELLAL